MPVLRTMRIPVNAARSPTGGRPPLGLGALRGNNGAITSHNSSGRIGLAMVISSGAWVPVDIRVSAMTGSPQGEGFVRRSNESGPQATFQYKLDEALGICPDASVQSP